MAKWLACVKTLPYLRIVIQSKKQTPVREQIVPRYCNAAQFLYYDKLFDMIYYFFFVPNR